MSQSSEELPILDRDHLMQMTGDDSELASEIIEIFRHQAEIWSRLLDPRQPASRWADAAHTIKGAALSLGAMRLADRCGAAETLGRSGQPSIPEAALALGEIKDELGTALEAAAVLAHQLVVSGSLKAS
jgi:HPt (histidine-containing phosphotransfer) domain-containing protein